ncbi:MAG: hypothetical protein IKK89_04735 [Alistipes sp.]|nr:hypothetical protein [Alistipes sp.]MBR6631233.1 hypothetical protein [Alistipes sp.]
MTLYDLIQKIEDIAIAQPSIQMIVENDAYRLNEIADARYAVFAFTQGVHTSSADNDFMTFNFTLFYIDRLSDDGRNQINVQSVGIQTLDNILATLEEEGIHVGDYSVQPFTQKFIDMCAGVYTTVGLIVPKSVICAEPFIKTTDKVIV